MNQKTFHFYWNDMLKLVCKVNRFFVKNLIRPHTHNTHNDFDSIKLKICKSNIDILIPYLFIYSNSMRTKLSIQYLIHLLEPCGLLLVMLP